MKSTALLGAALSLAEADTEVSVIDRLVDIGRRLFSASFGAALLVGPDGQPSALAHDGMSTAEVAVLPHLPRPVGLLGVVLGGVSLNLADLATHPGAIGLPPGHVEMVALMAAPITAGDRVVGGVWFTRRRDEGTFSGEDEQQLAALVRLAGLSVVDTQRREAAQTVAMRLATTGMNADGAATDQVIGTLLANARDILGTDITFLSKIDAGRQQFTDVHEGPANAFDTAVVEALSSAHIDAESGYCRAMLDGRIPSVVSDVAAHPQLGQLAVTHQLGVGSYAGVPVHLPNGELFGTLCGLNAGTGIRPSATHMETLAVIANLVGAAVARREVETENAQADVRAFDVWFTADRLAVYLQPIVDLATGQSVGFEALSRFTDSYGAPRRPDLMFAEAAQLGVGAALEQTAVRAALAHLHALPGSSYLSVNLSPQALLIPSTFDLLTAAVRDAPGRLVVELTEHEQVSDYPALLKVLAGLRERGLRLAVDDTGAGFSSLQHVTVMRPDILKLDIAFVRDVHLNPGHRAVARALTAFAEDIGASLVAEGIETPDELEALIALGAPLGQGYLLGRPAPAREILDVHADAN